MTFRSNSWNVHPEKLIFNNGVTLYKYINGALKGVMAWIDFVKMNCRIIQLFNLFNILIFLFFFIFKFCVAIFCCLEGLTQWKHQNPSWIQGFIQAILMSGRRHKKLNLLFKFSNSIFVKFYIKAYWPWTCIQNRLV